MNENDYQRYVIAFAEIEGIHYWKLCPYTEVDYLKVPHRHRFMIRAAIEVTHNDRDVEFIILSHEIKRWLTKQYYSEKYQCCDFGNLSCEMIAEMLIDQFNLTWCEVSEDGEGGAIVYNKSTNNANEPIKKQNEETFEILPLELDNHTIDLVVKSFVERLGPESRATFEDTLAQTGDIKQALLEAVINDQVLALVQRHIDESRRTSK